MILIITRRDDVHADLVIRELDVLGESVFRLNTEVVDEYEITLTPDQGIIAHPATGREIQTSQVKSVWLRRRSFPESLPDDYRAFLEQEWTLFLRNLWVTLGDAFWISHPLALEVARDKLNQLRLARKIGFNVPRTVVTNSARHVGKLQANNPQIIYKPHDGGYVDRKHEQVIYTNLIEETITSEEHGESLRINPGIFQDYLEKNHEVRVTVVGPKVFAARIDSQSSNRTRVDWRRYDQRMVEHTAMNLPSEIEEHCVKLVESLNLQFGAIDLVVTPDGKYYFLEINANGQWAWIEIITGQPIANAIAQLLARRG